MLMVINPDFLTPPPQYMDVICVCPPKPSHRCTNEQRPNTTACIAEYVQSYVGCNVNILGGSSDFQNATCSEEQGRDSIDTNLA